MHTQTELSIWGVGNIVTYLWQVWKVWQAIAHTRQVRKCTEQAELGVWGERADPRPSRDHHTRPAEDHRDHLSHISIKLLKCAIQLLLISAGSKRSLKLKLYEKILPTILTAFKRVAQYFYDFIMIPPGISMLWWREEYIPQNSMSKKHLFINYDEIYRSVTISTWYCHTKWLLVGWVSVTDWVGDLWCVIGDVKCQLYTEHPKNAQNSRPIMLAQPWIWAQYQIP